MFPQGALFKPRIALLYEVFLFQMILFLYFLSTFFTGNINKSYFPTFKVHNKLKLIYERKNHRKPRKP